MDFGKFLFSFNGRITRKAFLIYLAASFVVGMLVNVLGMPPQPVIEPSATPEEALAAVKGFYASIPIWVWLFLALQVYVFCAVTAKRWHDQDRSGWFSLLSLIPFIGVLIVLIMAAVIPGIPGPNRFGNAPMA